MADQGIAFALAERLLADLNRSWPRCHRRFFLLPYGIADLFPMKVPREPGRKRREIPQGWVGRCPSKARWAMAGEISPFLPRHAQSVEFIEPIERPVAVGPRWSGSGQE